jgi:hypothetical protein
MTGSSSPAFASSVRSRPKLSSAGVLLLPARRDAPGPWVRRLRRLLRFLRRLFLLVLDARAQEVQDLLADFLELEAEVHEHLRGDAVVLAQQAEQEVLGAHVVVVEVASLFDGVLDDLLGSRGLRELAHRDHLRATLDELLDFEANLAKVDVEVLEHVGPDPRPFLHEAEQDVLGPDVFVVESLRLLIGERHHLASTIGQPFEHSGLRSQCPRTRPRDGLPLRDPAHRRGTRRRPVRVPVGVLVGDPRGAPRPERHA